MKYLSLAIAILLSAHPVYAQLGTFIQTVGPLAGAAAQAQAQASAQENAFLLQVLAAKMQADRANAADAARVRLFVSKAKAAIDSDIGQLGLFGRVAQQYWDACIPLLNDLYTTNPDASTSEVTDAIAGPRQEYGHKVQEFRTRAQTMLTAIVDSVKMNTMMADKFWSKTDTALGPLFGNNLDTPTWGMRLAIDSLIPQFVPKKESKKPQKRRSKSPN